MTDQVDNNEAVTTDEQQVPSFVIQRIYVKDISFEAPNLPELFGVEFKPEVKMEMNTNSRKVGDDHFEVVLNITLNAKIGEKTAFLAEVQQAGLFLIKGFTDQQTHQLVGAAAPEALYPYVREAISSLIGKSGLPTIQLTPINFMGLYMENMQKAQAQAQANQADSENTTPETIQ